MTLTPPNPDHIRWDTWRTIRAHAQHISQEHRRYLHTHGRLPNCPLHRLETAPLWRYLRATETETDPAWDDTETADRTALTDNYIARRLGYEIKHARAKVARMRRGHISREEAEQIAHHLGEYPTAIWADYLFDVEGDCDEEAA